MNTLYAGVRVLVKGVPDRENIYEPRPAAGQAQRRYRVTVLAAEFTYGDRVTVRWTGQSRLIRKDGTTSDTSMSRLYGGWEPDSETAAQFRAEADRLLRDAVRGIGR